MYKFYAKSLPKPYGETIEEHTSKVKKNFESLKNFINIDEKEESIIEKIIEFHDLGKINPLFQNKIRKRLNIKELFDYKNVKIYHEWLSPSFINEKEELIIKEKLKEMNLDADRFFNLFIFINLSHHYRENQMADDDLINEMICWIKNNFRYEVDYFYNVNHLLNLYNNTENREMWNLFFSYRVTWLGALLKSDYCASAGIEPEQKYNGSYSLDFDRFIYEKKIKLKDFQIKAKENKDKNIILVASTGIGKTEAAMNWINGQKAFYLLGIRIAVNEMYKRFRYIFGENVALLHGESSYFFAQQDEDNQQDEDDLKIKIEKCRKLCYPLTVATADQLVTAVFKYAGFELTYFTCKYSKIII
ncbi:MAG TPA: CRISPR-associated endonuclease Cas3'', partial [Exilispira sp.]|nr:CRISPR-associated endonuclease Cas3'' [Exilispira sp.]